MRNIFVVLTPFHLYQTLAIIQSSYFTDKNVLITIDIIPQEIISNLKKSNIFSEIYQLPVLEFKKKYFDSHNKIINIICRILGRAIIRMYFPFPHIDFNCSKLFIFNDQTTISDWLFYNIRRQNKVKPLIIHLPDGFGSFYQEEPKEPILLKLFKKIKYIIGSSMSYGQYNCLGESPMTDEFQVINPMNFPIVQPEKVLSKVRKADSKIESFICSPPEEFRNLIYNVYNLKSVDSINEKFRNKRVIFIYTQTFDKKYKINEFYVKLINKLRKLNFEIILKPHPRQTEDEFKFLVNLVYVLPSKICVEALFTGFPELFLNSYHLTAHSTVALSLLSYLNLDPSRLILYYKLLGIKNDSIDNYLLKIANLWNIFIPTSIDDLEAYLNLNYNESVKL